MAKRKVAVFDIDGTIFRSSLLIELTEGLIQAGIFPRKVEKVYATAYRAWLSRTGSYEDYIAGVIKGFEKYIRGVPMADFRRVSRSVAMFHRGRVYRYTRDLVAKLKKKGYFLLAISHSPKTVVDFFAEHLGFDKIYARLHELDARGRLLPGTLYPDLIFDKAKVLRRAMEKEGLALRGSVGVGDTSSDISFLKLVDRPICFNPNAGLYRYAKRHGWKIVVERKDVVYEVGGGG